MAAPFVTTTLGVVALGALTNVGQTLLANYLEGCETTQSDVANSLIFGGISGLLGGVLKPRAGLNFTGNRVVGGAVQGGVRSGLTGGATTFTSEVVTGDNQDGLFSGLAGDAR